MCEGLIPWKIGNSREHVRLTRTKYTSYCYFSTSGSTDIVLSDETGMRFTSKWVEVVWWLWLDKMRLSLKRRGWLAASRTLMDEGTNKRLEKKYYRVIWSAAQILHYRHISNEECSTRKHFYFFHLSKNNYDSRFVIRVFVNYSHIKIIRYINIQLQIIRNNKPFKKNKICDAWYYRWWDQIDTANSD